MMRLSAVAMSAASTVDRQALSRGWLRVVVSAVAATILLTFVPVAEVFHAVRDVNPWAWAASVGIFMAGHVLNAMKLRVLLGWGTATAGSCLRAHFTGIASNLWLPGVAGGDIIRAVHLSRSAGVPAVTAAAVANRILDALVLLGLVAGAASMGDLPVRLVPTGVIGRWIVGVAVAAIVVLALAVVGMRPRARSRFGAAWSTIAARPHAVMVAIAMSAGVQTAFVLTHVWLASQTGMDIAVSPWFVAWAGSKLSAVLPISVGGLGVREATLVSILVAYGAPADAVLATGILWQGALVVGSLTGFLIVQASRT